MIINYDIPNYISDYQASAPKSNLKGFDDLVFKSHAGFADGKAIQAMLDFGSRNQFTISVVQNIADGTGLYGDHSDNTYEVAMWYDGRDTMLPLSVGDDVLAWQTPTQITKLMHQAHLNDFAWVTLLHSIRQQHNKELGLDNLDQY
tara:strand:- start:64 stop:501 length:438 start_codon:yes stop_codon:yes gene_type:complete